MNRLSITRAVLIPLGLALIASTSSAQCPNPDNLEGPCWQPTDVNLPTFPPINLAASGICYTDCDPAPKQPALLSMSPPAQIRCAEFGVQVTVSTPTGAPVLSGFGRLNYTRTWTETNLVTLERYQVWRMMFKIDMSEASLAPPTCWNPPCLNVAADTCFWYGYVDYAQNCTSGGFEQAVVLYHACDDFTHNPFLSSNPAPGSGFHPNTYYAIVAPDTAANPFDPTPILTPRSGALGTEAVRNVASINPSFLCVKEERLSAGNHNVLGTACLCPIAPTPARQAAVNVSGLGSCPDTTGAPSSFLSFGIFNPTVGFNWFDVISTQLGSWTTIGPYPGNETASVQEGFFLYHDSCADIFGLAPDTLDIMYGSKTTGGHFPEDLFGIVLPDAFVDYASNYSQPFISLPLIGNVNDATHLIYGNLF